MKKPAILGGTPEFLEKLAVSKPTLALNEELMKKTEAMLTSGMLTNHFHVSKFEDECAKYLGVKHAVAVSSCTAGLMLVLRCLDISGDVLVPSFTFFASVHAIVWNGLNPVFIDCEPGSCNISLQEIKKQVTPNTRAIMGVHVYGNPCDAKELEKLALQLEIPVIFDAAHAFGARYADGKMVGGRGAAEIFSFSPTKILVAGEGGLITTNDGELAQKLRLARNYGKTSDYNCYFPGLNARMTEFNAILGLSNLELIEKFLEQREKRVAQYRDSLKNVPGLRFQEVHLGSRNVYKDLGIYIAPKAYGLTRDELAVVLSYENIDTRKYFFPPAHRLELYAAIQQNSKSSLPVTEDLSNNILCLPIFSHMESEVVEKISKCIHAAYNYRSEIKNILDNSTC